MGKSPEVMIVNKDRTFSPGKVDRIQFFPDGRESWLIRSPDREGIGIHRIGDWTIIMEFVENLATPDMEEIYIDCLPRCRFSPS